ncbi:MAG: CBS domain-containing protein [Thaumarchaeota archaeon]|nr:CBS domain-containing protein [Nitrososphaerota archaeon]
MLNIGVRVRAFMNTKMDAVEVGGSVKEAVKKMVDAEIESVLVTKGGDPIGIITERDILQRVVYAGANTDKRVEEIMSHPLITVDPLATLGDAAQIMLQKKIRRLLVKEGEKIVGIITQRDLQRAFMETFNTLLLT